MEALENSGLSERIAASRLVPRSAIPPEYAPVAEAEEPEAGNENETSPGRGN